MITTVPEFSAKRLAQVARYHWTFSLAEWLDRCAAFGYCCAYCGEQALHVSDLVIDHLVPSWRGGSHDLENAVPSCRSCNASKRDLLLLEWVMVQSRMWKFSGRGPCYTKLRLNTGPGELFAFDEPPKKKRGKRG